MKGRPPKPAEVHRRNGNPGRHAGRDEPLNVGGAGVPEAPKQLDSDGKRAWDDLVRGRESILDVADGSLLEQAAVALGRLRATRARLIEVRKRERKARRDGELVEEVALAELAMSLERHEQKWMAEFRQLADRLGIGPVARARLNIAGGDRKPPAKPANDAPENPRARRAALRAVEGGV